MKSFICSRSEILIALLGYKFFQVGNCFTVKIAGSLGELVKAMLDFTKGSTNIIILYIRHSPTVIALST